MPTEVKQYDFWLKYGELHREERVGGDYVLASDCDKLEVIINATLRELPVGYIPAHTPESIPERVAYYVKECVRLEADYDKLVEVCRELLEVEGVQGWDCESSPEPMPEKYNVAHDKLLTLIGKAKAIAIVGEKSPVVPTP